MITIISGPQGSGKTRMAKGIVETFIVADQIPSLFDTLTDGAMSINTIDSLAVQEARFPDHRENILEVADRVPVLVICTQNETVSFWFLEALTNEREVEIIRLGD